LIDGLALLNVQGCWFLERFEHRTIDGDRVRVVLEKRQLSKKEIRDLVPSRLR
jgi:hypothetical protein